jgi:hypothetical protein
MWTPRDYVSKPVQLHLLQHTVEPKWEGNGNAAATTIGSFAVRVYVVGIVGMIVIVMLDKVSLLVLSNEACEKKEVSRPKSWNTEYVENRVSCS